MQKVPGLKKIANFGFFFRNLVRFFVKLLNPVESSEFFDLCCSMNEGFSSYPIEMTSKSHFEIFELSDIIVLSPDASVPLENLELGKVYIIGGILDERRNNPVMLNQAVEKRVQVRRLPISENLERNLKAKNFSEILTPNQVFDILINFNTTRNWKTALKLGVPQKKGFLIK